MHFFYSLKLKEDYPLSVGSSGFSVGKMMGCGLVSFKLFGMAEGLIKGTRLLALFATLPMVPSRGPMPATRPLGGRSYQSAGRV